MVLLLGIQMINRLKMVNLKTNLSLLLHETVEMSQCIRSVGSAAATNHLIKKRGLSAGKKTSMLIAHLAQPLKK